MPVKNCRSSKKRHRLLCHKYLASHISRFSDAVLSCIFNTEVDKEPRIEWKKTGKDVSFVYFQEQFRGENQARGFESDTMRKHRGDRNDK